jgi:hypothetical protein
MFWKSAVAALTRQHGKQRAWLRESARLGTQRVR